MRAALVALAILLLPAALIAQPSIGIYFTGGAMHYSPAQYEEFTGYVLLNGLDCYVTAVEFAVQMPPYPSIDLSSFEIPPNGVAIGNPEAGISIAYTPPLVGFDGGNLLCTLNFYARKGCDPESFFDVFIEVVPDPNAVPTPGVLATCWPDNEILMLQGLKTNICPSEIGVQSTSWGAIKGLYEK